MGLSTSGSCFSPISSIDLSQKVRVRRTRVRGLHIHLHARAGHGVHHLALEAADEGEVRAQVEGNHARQRRAS